MPDYKNAKIYTIRCRTDNSLIYVGSTCETLSQRLARHRKSSKLEKCKNYLIYQKINGNWSDWYIELYELYPCDTKEQLLKREGEIIRLMGNLNKNIPGRTKKEWENDNKEKRFDQQKEYNEKNKEKKQEYDKKRREDKKEILADQRKQYYEANKEKLSEYNKEWREQNKEVIAEKYKQKYENNKDKISEQRKEKITCTCGCEIRKDDLKRHQKSKKHLDLIQSVN